MKKFFKDNYSLAVALMAATTFAACSGSDDIIDDNMQQSTVQKTYTLTVTASKGGDAMTRALSLDGSTQAIVKFTLKNTDGSADLSASGLNHHKRAKEPRENKRFSRSSLAP